MDTGLNPFFLFFYFLKDGPSIWVGCCFFLLILKQGATDIKNIIKWY